MRAHCRVLGARLNGAGGWPPGREQQPRRSGPEVVTFHQEPSSHCRLKIARSPRGICIHTAPSGVSAALGCHFRALHVLALVRLRPGISHPQACPGPVCRQGLDADLSPNSLRYPKPLALAHPTASVQSCSGQLGPGLMAHVLTTASPPLLT